MSDQHKKHKERARGSWNEHSWWKVQGAGAEDPRKKGWLVGGKHECRSQQPDGRALTWGTGEGTGAQAARHLDYKLGARCSVLFLQAARFLPLAF